MRRAVLLGEDQAVPRISDLPSLTTSTMGKLEMESIEDGREGKVLEEITKKAVVNVFGRHFSVHDFDDLVKKFEEGTKLARLLLKKLDQAKKRVEVLVKNHVGDATLQPFDDDTDREAEKDADNPPF